MDQFLPHLLHQLFLANMNDALLVLATLVLFDGIVSSETAADSEFRALLLALDLVLLTEAC